MRLLEGMLEGWRLRPREDVSAVGQNLSMTLSYSYGEAQSGGCAIWLHRLTPSDNRRPVERIYDMSVYSSNGWRPIEWLWCGEWWRPNRHNAPRDDLARCSIPYKAKELYFQISVNLQYRMSFSSGVVYNGLMGSRGYRIVIL